MNIRHNLDKLRYLIQQTALDNKRDPDEILLLAVSKQQSTQAIREAYHQGQLHFGENYFQEAQQKITTLAELPLIWHFIGPIQSNKTKGLAHNFAWVHSVDRAKVAQLLNEFRPTDKEPLNVCLQINLVHEATKSGIAPDEAFELATLITQLPHLRLRGLMTIPPPMSDEQQQYELFLKMQDLLKLLNQKLHLKLDTLSMGMSDDLVPAIKAGATIVRIGRAIFGERQSY